MHKEDNKTDFLKVDGCYDADIDGSKIVLFHMNMARAENLGQPMKQRQLLIFLILSKANFPIFLKLF